MEARESGGAVLLDPRKDERWLEFADRERLGLFGSPPWLSAVADTYGFEAEAVVVLDGDGTIRSGFPFSSVFLSGSPLSASASLLSR